MKEGVTFLCQSMIYPDELQAIERKLLGEIETLEKEFKFKDHNILFYQIIEKKISLFKEYLGIIEANPTITLYELRHW